MRITSASVAVLALTLAFVGCGKNETAATPGRSNEPWGPGTCDATILRHLKHTLQVLRDGNITLKDVAPEYHVEAEDGLTWQQALTAADKRFPDDPIKRALFVGHHVTAGMQASQLKDLGVPEAMSCFIGKAYDVPVPFSLGYHTHGYYSADVNAAPEVQLVFRVNTLTAAGSSGDPFGRPVQGTINGPGEVSLDFIQVGGVHFQTLTFDMDGRVTSFWQQTVPVGPSLHAYMEGLWDRSNDFTAFHVSIYPKEDGYIREWIEFTQAVKMKQRDVYDTETHELTYSEVYEAGRLRQRLHYRSGDRVTPWRTEEF